MNLAHIPIETLKSLPTKLKSFQQFKSGFNISERYLKRYYHRWNYDSKIYNLIEKIVLSSIGENVDKIYSKVRPLLNNVIGDSPHNFFRSIIDKPNLIIDENPYYFGYRYRRTEKLFINGNIISIRKEKWKRYRIRHDKSWFLNRRRDNKLKKKEKLLHELTLIKLINIPDLFSYYNKLYKEECYLSKQINDKGRPIPSRSYYSYKDRKYINRPYSEYNKDLKWWKLWESLRKNAAETAKIKIIKVQESLNKIRNGDYSEFYRSNEYLFSIPKECHHFANL